MFAHEFVRNAYLAGSFIALAAGTVGWFVVLRGQVFVGDALGHVAFVGAIAAAVLGLDVRTGLFALTLALAALLGVARRSAAEDDAAVGVTFAWILGLGVLLLAILATSGGGGNGVTTANALFGSIFSLSTGGAWLAAGLAAAVTLGLLASARPLLLSTLEPELARLRGVPVRLLSAGFLAALAVIAAESAQAVGALLLLGLIAAPAGAARALTARPWAGLGLAGGLAMLSVWLGLALSYAVAPLPPSSAIIAVAAALYAFAAAFGRRARARAGNGRRSLGSAGGRGGAGVREPPSSGSRPSPESAIPLD